MRSIYICLGLISIILLGCLNDAEDNSINSQPISVQKINDISISDRIVTFNLRCEIPTPCWIFEKSAYSKNDNQYNIVIYGREKSNDPCIQVISSLSVPFSVEVPSAGSYTFKFLQNVETTLDITLVIN